MDSQMSSNNLTVHASEAKNIHHTNQPSDNITDELNQSCGTKKIVQMSMNTLGKYVTHTNSPQNWKNVYNTSARCRDIL